ncbi:MAG: cofactor-independent phosphoglycerate mutase [Deltaproteobacteria bacterium]|nr:cofactor-independent phosphoglycerate mutase [Deltaproteobacteria bacterium]
MKHIILLGDGMADNPVTSLGGKTPLEFSHTPNMDRMAAEGTLGLIDTIPAGISPGSDVANLAVLGYDPRQCYSGRGPLEAANIGVTLGTDDVAFRCNLVTLGGDDNPTMLDFTAGHISSETAKTIIHDLHDHLGSDIFAFYPGVSYRHLLVWKNGLGGMGTTPPHDITGREIKGFFPKGEGAPQLNDLMRLAHDFLRDHPVNQRLIKEGKKPANAIWLWGQGRAPQIVPLTLKYNLKGGMISAVDLLNGIGIYAGLKVIPVEGATGYTDTNYLGKAKNALAALQELDFMFLHVEAPDEMGHEGNLEGKIKAIEDFDEKIVGPILEGMPKFGAFRVMVLSDHPTPIALMTHGSEPSPFAVYSSRADENLAHGRFYGETAAREEGIIISPGHLLMNYFIRDWSSLVHEKSH